MFIFKSEVNVVDYELMWLVVLIFLVIAEAVSLQLFAVWFAIGALGSLIAAFFGADIIIQLIVFVIVSFILFLILRPLFKKITAKHFYDRIVSMTGVVIKEIGYNSRPGLVSVAGKEWSAQTEKNEMLEVGERIKVLRIESNKLIVERSD
ncbi:MAG: hypothetical protein DBX47_05640 [Clostridiales bacterium]|nr:MAG: hypothetical protein DBX47_05640 [Clostridiales bacterium]